MSTQKTEETTIPITIHLLPSTVERLEKISYYLSFRHYQHKPIERVIKAAIVDYLDLMTPLSEREKMNIKDLVLTNEKHVIKNRFRDIMKQKGIKAVQVHRSTGISESNLSQLLNNKNLNMTLDSFLKVWVCLDCPPIGDCIYIVNRN